MSHHERRQQHLDHLTMFLVAVFFATLLLFLIVLLYAATVGRFTISTISMELQENVEELQSIASDLDETVNELSAIVEDSEGAAQLDTVGSSLLDVNQNLQILESNIDQTLEDVAVIAEEDIPVPLPMAEAGGRDVDRLFTVFIWLLGVVCILTACALVMVRSSTQRGFRKLPAAPRIVPPQPPR